MRSNCHYWRRIHHEGRYVAFKAALAVCLGMLTELYASGGVAPRRTGLSFCSFPIADFGISKGAVFLQEEAPLAYKWADSKAPPFTFLNPDDHYWIYLTTARGEELVLDCLNPSWQVHSVIQATPYMSDFGRKIVCAEGMIFNPYFQTSDQDRTSLLRHTEHRRHSILRDSNMHQLVNLSDHPPTMSECINLFAFADAFTGAFRAGHHVFEDVDTGFIFMTTIERYAEMLQATLEKGTWRNFPSPPEVVFPEAIPTQELRPVRKKVKKAEEHSEKK
jgi:hypothetical protein